MKAHKAYKKHVRDIRKQRHLKLLEEAEKAAERHDMRSLCRVVEKIIHVIERRIAKTYAKK